MRRALKLLCLCLAAASAAAASSKKNSELEREIKSQLVNKTFATKILVGSYIPCHNSSRNDALKMVDTEFGTDGSVKYFARTNCFVRGGFLIDVSHGYISEDLSGKINPGTTVWVRAVDFKEDRVELHLSVHNDNDADGSGKIKYMLGAQYHNWSTDDLMEAIARGIRIPAYENLVRVKTEWAALVANLNDAQRKYDSSGASAAAKLEAALALKDVLEKIQKNRAEFAATGKSDPQAGAYAEKLNALTPEIAKLSAEVRTQKIAEVEGQLQKQATDISEIQKQVRQKPAGSNAAWQQQSERLARYSSLVADREKLLEQLQNLNDPPSPQEMSALAGDKAEIQSLQNALKQSHQQMELAELNSQYSQLSRKRAQALDAYSRAFATAKEKTALKDLVGVLDQIVANRDRAAGLGDAAAAGQLTKFRAEAEKYRKK